MKMAHYVLARHRLVGPTRFAVAWADHCHRTLRARPVSSRRLLRNGALPCTTCQAHSGGADQEPQEVKVRLVRYKGTHLFALKGRLAAGCEVCFDAVEVKWALEERHPGQNFDFLESPEWMDKGIPPPKDDPDADPEEGYTNVPLEVSRAINRIIHEEGIPWETALDPSGGAP